MIKLPPYNYKFTEEDQSLTVLLSWILNPDTFKKRRPMEAAATAMEKFIGSIKAEDAVVARLMKKLQATKAFDGRAIIGEGFDLLECQMTAGLAASRHKYTFDGDEWGGCGVLW